MDTRISPILLFGFVSGIFLSSFVDFGSAFAGFFIFLGIGLLFISFWLDKKVIVFFAALFFLFAGLGIFRYDFSRQGKGNEFFENNVGAEVVFNGIIVDEPDERENNTRLVVETNGVRILVYAEHYPKFNYGEELEIRGKIKKPDNFLEDFNWPLYLAKDNIFYEIFHPKIRFISSGNGFWLKERLFSLKRAFLQNISRVISSPHSALLGGLIVGSKEAMGKELLDKFRKAGIIHIVVLSGYNVTIVALAMMRVFSFLPQLFGVAFGSIGIILFALMTGASATIVRASIMALLVILARTTGRMHNITMALLVAGFLMLLHNPKILVFDPSFQLSFLSTIGLIYFSPLIEKKLEFLPEKWNIRELVIATLATQIFIFPFLLYKVGEISIVALPVNFLVLIFVPLTMLFGFLAGIFGFLSAIFSWPFAWLAYALLFYELKIVEAFSSLPFASIKLSFPLWITVIIYVIYAGIMIRINLGKQVLKGADFDIIDDI